MKLISYMCFFLGCLGAVAYGGYGVPGDENFNITRWTFNQNIGQCMSFQFFGNEGENPNNFVSRTECETECIIFPRKYERVWGSNFGEADFV